LASEQFGMSAGAAGTAQERDRPRGVEQRRQSFEIGLARAQHRLGRRDPGWRRRRERRERHVAGDDDHGDAAPADRGAHGAMEDLRHLLRTGNQLDVVAAFGEQAFGMGGLEVVDADLLARNMGGDRQHRHAAAMAVVEPVDEVQVAGPAAAGADRELAGEMRLGAGGEGRGLLVPHMDPINALQAAQRIGEGVERIAHHAVDALDARLLQRFGHEIGNGFRHIDISRTPPAHGEAYHATPRPQVFRRRAGAVTFAG
jgi:hypothetical protein